jgi:hypothetical protein
MMKSVSYLVTLAVLASAFPLLASAFDPSPLQDFCVAINDSSSAGMYILYIVISVVVAVRSSRSSNSIYLFI